MQISKRVLTFSRSNALSSLSPCISSNSAFITSSSAHLKTPQKQYILKTKWQQFTANFTIPDGPEKTTPLFVPTTVVIYSTYWLGAWSLMASLRASRHWSLASLMAPQRLLRATIFIEQLNNSASSCHFSTRLSPVGWQKANKRISIATAVKL